MVWIVFIAILFVLPAAFPINLQTNFNYALLAVLVVLVGTGVWWQLSARNWFKGPRVQGSSDELAKMMGDTGYLHL